MRTAARPQRPRDQAPEGVQAGLASPLPAAVAIINININIYPQLPDTPQPSASASAPFLFNALSNTSPTNASPKIIAGSVRTSDLPTTRGALSPAPHPGAIHSPGPEFFSRTEASFTCSRPAGPGIFSPPFPFAHRRLVCLLGGLESGREAGPSGGGSWVREPGRWDGIRST